MKYRLVNILGVVLCGSVCTNAIANQVTLRNTSQDETPFTVVYKVAHKNPGASVFFSAPQTILLQKEEAIHFQMEGYELAGIVPISIDGHALPETAIEFDKPAQCSVTTDVNHDVGHIIINYTKLPNGHGNITCISQGGIFN